MITVFDETWLLDRPGDRRAVRVPSGYPGAAVRVSCAAVAGTITSALTVKWRDAGDPLDFATARTVGAGAFTLLSADDMQGVGEIVVTNPAAQTGVIARLTVAVETPARPEETPARV